MSLKRLSLIGICLLCYCSVALSDTMQLLSPPKGWALNGRLFWTSDDGEHWTDITPSQPGTIASVFFIDESRGWVLLRSDAGDDRVRFDLASTIDGGRTWSTSRIPIPEQFSAELSGAAWLDFADAEHGWVVLRKATSSAFSIGRLFATTDGGQAWHELPQIPLGEPVHFVSATEGWLVGDSGGGGFYHSGDGGKTWEGIELPDPSHSSTLTRAAYGQVRFTDPRNGSIPVIFSPVTDQTQKSRLVLYATVDGGRSWKVDRGTTDFRNRYGETPFPSTQVGSMLLSTPDATLMTLDPRGAQTSHPVRGVPANIVVKEISFATPEVGWLRMSDDKILSTSDGGATYRWLVPGAAPRMMPADVPKPIKLKTRVTVGERSLVPPIAANGQAASPGLHYTERLGFDKHEVWSSTGTQMDTWWASSPFFDVGFYVGGANYCYHSVNGVCQVRLDPNVNSGWVTTMTNQGWGLMPLWVGEQAPCITGNFNKFDLNTAKAQAEGNAEAVSAANAMASIGLAGTVIFYDMESYSASAGSPCSLAVQAFLTGWVIGMNANGFATTGVYGNSGPAQRDFSRVSNLSEVWVSWTLVNGNSQPVVTIWGLGSGSNALSDTLWNTSQRGHQFLIQTSSINYGGVSASIDYDVENFQISGGTGAKPYNWTVSTVNLLTSFPLANSAGVSGTNDVVAGTSATPAFITAGQAGQAAGTYAVFSPEEAYGFLNNNGTATSVSGPNSSYTFIFGLNDKSEIVGEYCFGPGSECSNETTIEESGYWASSPLLFPTFLNIDYATDNYNSVKIINDAEQMIGTYGGGLFGGDFSLFSYQSGQIALLSLLPCPGQASGSTLSVEAINGFNQLAGYYYDSSNNQHGFIYNMEASTNPAPCTQTDFPGAYGTNIVAINNQGQVYGNYCTTTTCGTFVEDGVFFYTGFSAFPLSQAAYLNDAAQVTSDLSSETNLTSYYVFSPI